MAEDKRLNEIIRVKRVDGNYTTMNKGFLEDDNLSMKSKGILAYLLSKPNDWKVIVGDIVKHCKDSKSAIYSGLKELKENGYYKKVPVRSEDGTRIVRWESTVYEVPVEVADEEPEKAFVLEQAVTKIKEKVTKTEQEQSISLFPNFQEVENQFIENKERNNNYNTNNYFTGELSSPSQTGVDGTIAAKMSEFFKRKINYADLVWNAHESDIKLTDEFINVALDCLLSDSSTVRINGENKPKELVKSRLMKLTYEHFTYVLERFKAQRQKIKKRRKYMLSMLYNSTMELQSYYCNAVATDLGI